MLKKRFKEYFTFTKKERNGIIVLLLILILLVSLRIYQSHKSYEEMKLMDKEFQQEIEEFESSLVRRIEKQEAKLEKEEKSTSKNLSWSKPANLFDFNPNKVSEDELLQLGFSQKQINTLIKYRANGGKFFKKEDLLKIYGIEKEQYAFLEPYIVISQSEKNKEVDVVEEMKILVELNSAKVEDLIKIKGIGDAYANRIIKYRNLLGGYSTVDQLLEVYGLDSAKFKGINEFVSIDTSFIQKLSLNKADFSNLIKHPYLNKYQTESILKYREVVGDFEDIEQIYRNKLLTKEEFRKLKPYLKLN